MSGRYSALRGTVIKSVCAKHPDRVLREGVTLPGGRISHGMCPECVAAFRADLATVVPRGEGAS